MTQEKRKSTESLRKKIAQKTQKLLKSEETGGIEINKTQEEYINASTAQQQNERELLQSARDKFGKNIQYDFLSKEEQYRLFDEWKNKNNSRAREQLILTFEPMIKTMCYDAKRRSNLSIEDLQNEARIALIKSLDQFDPSRGNSISTFARRPIQGALARYIMDMSGPCRVGSNAADIKVWRRFNQIRNEFEAEHKRPIEQSDFPELATRIGVKVNVLNRMLPRISRKDVELNAPVASDDNSGNDKIDMLSNDDSEAKNRIHPQDMKKALRLVKSAMSKLPERDRDILEQRLFRETPIHFKVIGEKYNLCKERVRQIEVIGMREIKNHLEKEGMNADALFR